MERKTIKCCFDCPQSTVRETRRGTEIVEVVVEIVVVVEVEIVLVVEA